MADELASFQSVISQYSMTRAQAATYIVGVVMSVDAATLGLNNQPNPNNPGGLSDLQLFQNQQSAAYNRTLVSGNFANQSANASNLNYPVAGPATNTGYIGAQTSETGVTFVSSTVVTAQGQISVAAAANNPALITGQAVPTDNIVLTTAIETVPAFGTLFINQTVSGVSQAAGGTFQTGDVINGGGAIANNVLNITGNGQATAGGELVTVNNVARVNTSLAANTGLQAANWTGVGQSWVSNVTAAGNTATLINGQLATTYGAYNTTLATTYNIGLRAGDVTGASSTLQLAASGAGGTGAANAFAIFSTTATGVEGISFAGSGTNNVTLGGNVGAATDLVSLTITGSGVNTIGTQGLTQLATVTAGTSTGTNVVNVGTSLVNNFTYTGGTGADTLQAATSGQVRTGLVLTGVETLRLDSGGANSTVAFASNPGLTTVRLDAGAGVAGNVKTLANVGTFTNLNYVGTSTTATAGNAMAFNSLVATGGFAGAADTLAISVSNGGITTTNAAPYTIGDMNIAGVETFAYTVSDNTANAPLAVRDIVSSTLQTVTFATNGIVTQTAADFITPNAANANSLTLVSLANVTGAAVSNVNIGDATGAAGTNTNVLSAAAQITAGAGGLTAVVDVVEATTDVLTFTGGIGNDTLTNTLYAGNVIANFGAGADTYTQTVAAQSATLTGGAGADTFNIRTIAGAFITDLGVGGVDVLNNLAGATVATVGANWTAGAGSTVAGGTVTLNAAAGVNNIALNGATTTVVGGIGLGYTVNADINTASTLVGSGGDDIIVGSSLADTITGGLLADRMTGGTGADIFGSANNLGGTGTSVVASANALSAPIAANDTITFATAAAGRVDYISDFSGLAGQGDKLDVTQAATAPTALVGTGIAAGNLLAGVTYVAYGNYNTATGVFTIAAAYGPAATDALLVQGTGGAQTAINATGYVVLDNLTAALVANDFV